MSVVQNDLKQSTLGCETAVRYASSPRLIAFQEPNEVTSNDLQALHEQPIAFWFRPRRTRSLVLRFPVGCRSATGRGRVPLSPNGGKTEGKENPPDEPDAVSRSALPEHCYVTRERKTLESSLNESKPQASSSVSHPHPEIRTQTNKSPKIAWLIGFSPCDNFT